MGGYTIEARQRQSEASDKARGDMVKLITMISTIGTDLGSAKAAVAELASALRPIRTQVDDLRSKFATQSTILQGEQEQYGRAAANWAVRARGSFQKSSTPPAAKPWPTT